MATNKVDLFKADKSFSARVNEYMTATVWAAIINARYNAAVEKLNNRIENAESLRGSILDVDGHVDELIASLKQELVDIAKQHEDDLDKQGRFAFNESEKDFYVDYKNAKDLAGISQAIVDFCAGYKLDVKNSDLLNDLIYAVSGRKAASGRKVITSGATTFTTVRSKNDVLKALYGVLTEKMIQAGTLKIMDIPSDVRAMYDKKRKGNK